LAFNQIFYKIERPNETFGNNENNNKNNNKEQIPSPDDEDAVEVKNSINYLQRNINIKFWLKNIIVFLYCNLLIHREVPMMKI
jgi:hypothetical protein